MYWPWEWSWYWIGFAASLLLLMGLTCCLTYGHLKTNENNNYGMVGVVLFVIVALTLSATRWLLGLNSFDLYLGIFLFAGAFAFDILLLKFLDIIPPFYTKFPKLRFRKSPA